MKNKKISTKQNIIRILTGVLCVVCIFFSVPGEVYADDNSSDSPTHGGVARRREMGHSPYSGAYPEEMAVYEPSEIEKMLYGELETESQSIPSSFPEQSASKKKGIGASLNEWMGEYFAEDAKEINDFLSGIEIDLSIDGIIFGRMAYSLGDGGYVKSDFTHFGLEANNPWGIIGATVFYSLRGVVIVLMPIVLMAMFLVQMIKHDPKGMAKLKNLLIHTVFVFALLFMLPYFIDLFILLRDVCMHGVKTTLNELAAWITGGRSVGNKGIFDEIYTIAMERPSTINGLIAVAAAGAGVCYLADYVRIALWMMGAFALFPVYALISFWNPKKLNEWCAIFFPNFFVPFIDMILVSVPILLNSLFERFYNSAAATVVLAVIDLIVIWASVAVRNRLVKSLGFDGIGGAANLGQMLNTLSHAFGGHGGNDSRHRDDNPDKKPSPQEDAERQRSAESMGREMDSAVDDMIEKEDHDLFAGAEHESDSTDKFLNGQEFGDVEAGEGNDMFDADGIPEGLEPAEDMLNEMSSEIVEESPLGGLINADSAEGVAEEQLAVPGVELGANGGIETVPSAAEEAGMPERFTGDVADNDGIRTSDTMSVPVGGDYMPSPISHEEYSRHFDSDFANSYEMSGDERGLARYENLSRRDALREKVSTNEAVMQKAGYERDTYDETRFALAERRDSLGGRIGELEREMSGMKSSGMAGTVEYKQKEDLLRKTSESYDNTTNRISGLDTARKADMDNQAYRREIDKCDRNESRYAEINSYNGNSSRSYASADAYKHQRRVEEIKKAQMNYKNFDSAQYKGLLSPEEEARYYRERESNRVRDKAIDVAKTVGKTGAKVAVGSVLAAGGMFVAGYAGQTASMAAGIAGAKLGGKVVDGASHIPGYAVGAAEKAIDIAKRSEDQALAMYIRSQERTRMQRNTTESREASMKRVTKRTEEHAREGAKSASEIRSELEGRMEQIYDQKVKK